MVRRFCAQLQFVIAFLSSHPNEIRRNAIQFDNANKKKVINRLQKTCTDVQMTTTQDEYQFRLVKFLPSTCTLWDDDEESSL